MNRNRKILLNIFIIYFCIGLTSCSVFYGPKAPQRSFKPTDLLITIEDLPAGYHVRWGPREGNDIERSPVSGEIVFATDQYPESLGVSMNVYQYSTEVIAQRDFSMIPKYDTNDTNYKIDFQSKKADQSYFGCYLYSNSTFPVCNWIARYKEFTVLFTCWLEPGLMDFSKMEGIIKEIDSRMVQHLYTTN